MELTFEEMRRHVCGEGSFRDIVTDDIRDAIRERMPAHLWIDTDDRYTGERTYRCDGCGSEWTSRKHSTGWSIPCKQNMEASCPDCGGAVYVKSLYKGHAFKDKLNVVWYRKSAVDPQALVAIAAHCQRDYDTDRPWTVETEIQWRGAAVFRYGEGSVRWQQRLKWEFCGQWVGTPEWRCVKCMDRMTFGSESIGMFGAESPPKHILTDTLTDALQGTPFARAWHDDYLMLHEGQDGAKALDLIARYPCVEYMTKLGMNGLVCEKLAGELPPGLVNWRGKGIDRVLKLSAQRRGEMKAAKIAPNGKLLAVLRYCDEAGLNIPVKTAQLLVRMLGVTQARECGDELGALLEMHRSERRRKALKYIAGQWQRASLRDVRDFWRQCVRLGTDMSDDREVFPRDLHAKHEEYTRRIRLAKSAEKDAMIAGRTEELARRFGFEFGGLILRPAASSEEVIREGQALGHCVGGYVDRYAKGETVICVLRRAVEPDAPWRTVEISPKGGYVIQDRGYRNDRGGIELDDKYRMALDMFWEVWRERKKGREVA